MSKKEKSANLRWTGSAFAWPAIILVTLLIGGSAGFVVGTTLKEPTYQFIANTDAYEPDLQAAYAKYEAAKGGDLSKTMSVDEMINVAYMKFGKEEQTYSRGVGVAKAMGLVDQYIWSTTVADNGRYFEESISLSSFVQIYDRMFEEGETVTTYWGGDDNFASHPKEELNRDDYKEKMGRYVSEALIYVVSGKTLVNDASTKSGKPASGIYKDGENYVLEAELSPKLGTIRYKKQMKTISDLASQPDFEFCHITVTTDADLNLIRMDTHESYKAVTKMGLGSGVTGGLSTAYYHESPPFGFPEPGTVLPEYPKSI